MSDDPLAKYRRVGKRDKNSSDKHTVFSHETDAAELVGGKRHRGSGASPWKKSDASSNVFQVECKQTGNESLSLKLEWLTKIEREAMGCGKVPALHVRFLKNQSDWVMIPAYMLKRLLSNDS